MGSSSSRKRPYSFAIAVADRLHFGPTLPTQSPNFSPHQRAAALPCLARFDHGACMNHDLEWNAGELSCGDLVLELRQRMRASPGKVFKVIALDAGAPADLPAWCRMTGHQLLAQEPTEQAYWIRAKP